MKIKRKHKAALKLTPPAEKTALLTPNELQELRLRISTVQQAKNIALLVEEAYQKWLKEKAQTYGFPGHVTIDPGSGLIREKAASNA